MRSGASHATSGGKASASHAKPACALPAALDAPIALDTLFARTAPEPRRKRSIFAPAGPARPLRTAGPSALVLIINVVRCDNCGAVTRSPNRNTLVRYDDDGPAHSIQYTRNDVAQFTHLPREKREYAGTAPFCEACF